MALPKSFDTSEIIQIAESVSREKALSKEIIISAMEESLAAIVRKKYGNAASVKLKIDRMTGDFKVYNELIVVSDELAAQYAHAASVENVETQDDDQARKDLNAEHNNHANDSDNPADKTKTAPLSSSDIIDTSNHNTLDSAHHITDGKPSFNTRDISRSNSSNNNDGDPHNDENQDDSENEQNDVVNHLSSISLSLAREIDKEANIGDYIREPLPPLNFDRLAVQNAKQLISAKLTAIEKEREYEEYKDKIGEIFVGTVDKVDRSGLTVRIKNAEAVIKYNQLLRNDHFKQGAKIKACLIQIDKKSIGPQLILSRTDESFLPPLMKSEIPELYSGEIKIISVAREAGSRSKVAVHSSEIGFDPVGACIGMKGSRIKSVMNEIGGEKIDIIQWAPDPVQFIVNAFRPVITQQIAIDEDNNKIEVVVNQAQLSTAIGRRGQNVRLISKLVNWNITVTSEELSSKKRNTDFADATATLSEALDIDNLFAQLLVSEGYDTAQKLATASFKDLVSLQSDAIDEEIANELIARAKEFCDSSDLASNDSLSVDAHDTADITQNSTTINNTSSIENDAHDAHDAKIINGSGNDDITAYGTNYTSDNTADDIAAHNASHDDGAIINEESKHDTNSSQDHAHITSAGTAQNHEAADQHYDKALADNKYKHADLSHDSDADPDPDFAAIDNATQQYTNASEGYGDFRNNTDNAANQKLAHKNTENDSTSAAPKLPRELVSALARNGVKTLRDIAELSVDDLEDIVGEEVDVDSNTLAGIISFARKKVYFDDAQ